MCGHLNSIGPVPSILFRMVARETDLYGGDGVGFAYFNKDGELREHKFIPNPKFDLFLDIAKMVGMRDIGNTNEMFSKNNILREVECEEHSIRSIHTRKLTSGEISLEQTQPFIIKNNDITYIVCHKGTIYNYNLIALDLDLGVIPKNDSHMVALAISQGKEAALVDIIEGKAIVSYYKTNSPNTLYTFCISDDINYSPDLYYLKLYNKSFMVGTTYYMLNSISDVLTTNDRPKSIVYKIPRDCIYKITTDEISLVKKIVPLPKTKALPAGTFDIGSYSDYKDVKNTLNIPGSKSRIVEQNFVYYINNRPAHSEVIYGRKGRILDLTPIYVTPNGFILESEVNKDNIVEYYRMNDEFYGDETTLTHAPVFELYFYKGILLSNKEAALRVFEGNTLQAKALSGYAEYPVQKDLDGTSVVNFYFNRDPQRKFILPLFSMTEYEMIGTKKIKEVRLSMLKAKPIWEQALSKYRVSEEA